MPAAEYRQVSVTKNFVYAVDCDSISKKQLLINVSNGLGIINSKDSIANDQAEMLIRTFNTLHQTALSENPVDSSLFNYYKHSFEKRFFVIENLKELGLTIAKGYTFYSPKYDLYVGNGGTLRCKDIYIVFN